MNLLVTVATNDFTPFQWSKPTLINYANRLNSKFISIEKSIYKDPHFDKLQAFQYAKYYERVLYVDSDIMIHPKTPNIFEVIPPGSLAAHNEAYKLSLEELYKRNSILQYWAKIHGFKNNIWPAFHVNTGVILLERKHLEKITPPPKITFKYLRDQCWFNMILCNCQIDFFNLPQYFNQMNPKPSMWDKPYFLHYAGKQNKIQLMKEVFHYWENQGYKHLANIS